MTMPQPPIASNVSIAVDQFLAHRRLDLQVDRQAQRLVVGAQPLVEILLDAGEAALVDVDAAQHLRGGAAQRIFAGAGSVRKSTPGMPRSLIVSSSRGVISRAR